MKAHPKERYNATRRKKYHSDPTYAEAVKDRVRLHRERMKKAREAERVALIASFVSRWKAAGVEDSDIAKRLTYLGTRIPKSITIDFDGNQVELISVPILAAELGFSPSTIRKWERQKAIPPAVHRDNSNRRWYSQFYLGLVADAIEAASKESAWGIDNLRTEVFARWQKHVKDPHGEERSLLAKAGPRPRYRRKARKAKTSS